MGNLLLRCVVFEVGRGTSSCTVPGPDSAVQTPGRYAAASACLSDTCSAGLGRHFDRRVLLAVRCDAFDQPKPLLLHVGGQPLLVPVRRIDLIGRAPAMDQPDRRVASTAADSIECDLEPTTRRFDRSPPRSAPRRVAGPAAHRRRVHHRGGVGQTRRDPKKQCLPPARPGVPDRSQHAAAHGRPGF